MGQFLSIEQARARHVPEGARRVEYARAKATAFLYELRGQPCYVLFKDRAGKPLKHLRFGDEAKRDAHLSGVVEALRTRVAELDSRRKARAAYRHDLKVGAVLCASWGYEQTNVEFFEVVGVPTGRTVELIELQQEKTYTGAMQGTCVPKCGEPVVGAVAFRRRVMPDFRGLSMVTLESFRLAFEWDGRPRSWTSYA